MPVTPVFEWEQSLVDVRIRVGMRGIRPSAIDVFITDLFIKVNAAPTHLLQLDVFDTIVVKKSSFRVDEGVVVITLPKLVEAEWPTLCVDKERLSGGRWEGEAEGVVCEGGGDADEASKTSNGLGCYDREHRGTLRDRRRRALERAEKLYNQKLETREQLKEVERKRMQGEQWELERQQRLAILERMRVERESEAQSLASWEETEMATLATAAAASWTSPAQIQALPVRPGAAAEPGVRHPGGTQHVSIDFTPRNLALPMRSRGDDEYYRRSRYRPVSIEDSPMFWKLRADEHYRAHDYDAAVSAYTESIKRDGCFLSCVSNRAACNLHLGAYDKAEEDCDLALTILASTPASDTTQERYKRQMAKLHARRGAARCWGGRYVKAREDLRVAVMYGHGEPEAAALQADLAAVEAYVAEHELESCQAPAADLSCEAARHYYAGRYADAATVYRQQLALDEFNIKARSNLCAVLLQQGRHREALAEGESIVTFCSDVASALAEPGAQSAAGVDSDDEVNGDDEGVVRRKAAARRIGERSGHVYVLLKAYVRIAAALCGLKDYRQAYDYLERAVRITPYDNDLRDDANRVLEKLKVDMLVRGPSDGDARSPLRA